MSTRQDTVDFILENLAALDVSARKMFGEYALYCEGKVAAFVCDDTLFVKILPENSELAQGLETGQAYPGSKPYYVVPGDRIEDPRWLQELIQITARAVPSKRK
ncbi:TfoX family protein [Candidatus Saccharibacteria bacterium]|nr:MAG: TfoX family protein [Candidatus Saccharibacteria bacterium]